jgi:hypothetical protein
MQIELSEDQYKGMPVPRLSKPAANAGRDSTTDVKILLGYMTDTSNGAGRENAPESWESALRQLGHVSIFAFATGEFMLIGPGGERVRGDSLAGALEEMLYRLGFKAGGVDETR